MINKLIAIFWLISLIIIIAIPCSLGFQEAMANIWSRIVVIINGFINLGAFTLLVAAFIGKGGGR